MTRDTSANPADLLESYRRHYNRPLAAMFAAARCPIEVRADGHYVIDESGRHYLDFSAGYGVFALGHLDPEVHQAALRQLSSMASVPPNCESRSRSMLMETLASLAPGDLNHVVLTGSGSEAIEVAQGVAHLARPGRRKMIATTTGYHGKSLGAMTILGQRHLTDPFFTACQTTSFVPFADIDALRAEVDESTLLVCIEPVVGGGYVTVPPPGYLTAVQELCRRAGALLIVDEVQTGFGRTGTLFGIQREEVVPDLLIVSKALSGGYVPMSATIISDSVYEDAARNAGAELPFNTEMPSSAMACAAAETAIKKIVADDLASHADRMGAILIPELRRLAGRYPALITSVDGQGLMIGVKLRNPFVEQALWLQMIHRGVMTGLSMNTVAANPALRIFPPLTVSEREIHQLVATLEESLADLTRKPAFIYDLINYASGRIQFWLPDQLIRLGANMFTPSARPAPPPKQVDSGIGAVYPTRG